MKYIATKNNKVSLVGLEIEKNRTYDIIKVRENDKLKFRIFVKEYVGYIFITDVEVRDNFISPREQNLDKILNYLE